VIRVSVEIREGVLTRCGSWARLSSARNCACQLARYLGMSRPLPNSPRQHPTERSKV
jgi:hypothetical protein